MIFRVQFADISILSQLKYVNWIIQICTYFVDIIIHAFITHCIWHRIVDLTNGCVRFEIFLIGFLGLQRPYHSLLLGEKNYNWKAHQSGSRFDSASGPSDSDTLVQNKKQRLMQAAWLWNLRSLHLFKRARFTVQSPLCIRIRNHLFAAIDCHVEILIRCQLI